MPPPIPFLPDKPVVLVGLMGVGKSSIGKRLAARLHLPFVDADHEIEQAADLSISEIFERFGEPYFRDGEARVIARLLAGAPKVIATGGGAFMHPRTRTQILKSAHTCWLDAEIDVLAERVARKSHRPLLNGRDAKTVLADLASLRTPVYALAPIHIKSTKGPPDMIVDQIIEKLRHA